MDGWIVVRKWDKFQRYSERRPPWIKLYTDLNSNDDWLGLSTAARGMLTTIWVEYARSGGHLRVGTCMQLCGKSARSKHLEALNHAGFIDVLASSPSPTRLGSHTETEEQQERLLRAGLSTAVASYAAEAAAAIHNHTSKPRQLPADLLEQLVTLRGADERTPQVLGSFIQRGLPEAAFRNALEATHEAANDKRLRGTEIGYFIGTLRQIEEGGQYA
jgi:hypothetical protein